MDSNYVAEKPLGYVQATGIDAATVLATKCPGGVIPAGTVLIRIIAEAQAFRYRDDGTAPTATVGQPAAVGVELYYTARSFAALQVISQVAGSILNCTFYGLGM